MQPACLALRVVPGATLRKPLLLMQPDYAYRDIIGIAEPAPLRLSVPDHDLPGDWPTWIEGVSGWTELNVDKRLQRFRVARVIDESTIEYNDISFNGQSISGGRLVYQLPVDLTGASAVLLITPSQGAALELSTANGGLVIAGPGRLVIVLTPEQTVAMTWPRANYTLDITWSNGDVSRWLHGPVEVSNGGCCHG